MLAMIQRGLIVHAEGVYLTCVHHKKQLWGFQDCVDHFTINKNWHKHDVPSLEQLAANIRNQNADESLGEHVVLQQYFGLHKIHGAFLVTCSVLYRNISMNF